MAYKILAEKRNALGYKELVITHMGQDMIAKLKLIECLYAEDGKTVMV